MVSFAKHFITLAKKLTCFYEIARPVVSGFLPLRTEFDHRSVCVIFVLQKLAMGQLFFLSNSVFPCQYHSTDAPYLSSSTCFFYQKDKRANPGNFPKSSCGSRGAVDVNVVLIVVVFEGFLLIFPHSLSDKASVDVHLSLCCEGFNL